MAYRFSLPLCLLAFFSFSNPVEAQSGFRHSPSSVSVDEKGLMRWSDTGEEVFGFGVNYTVPFAHAFRSAERLGVSREDAIAGDVYHFARLGFDLYRVHVWDCEISDTLGNLLENEHLRLFDYMLSLMKNRGMHFVLTPIAYWGNGWPEPDEPTPGFSAKYGKEQCLINEEAIKAQENYLFQFLNHTNPYTGIAYKDDPDIIAFEVSNEPHHRGSPKEVTAFINRMVQAMRRTGCQKPIFYNVSHSVHLMESYFNADIQGGTFQWYPTGLGAGEELGGNLLPNVDKYRIPFDDIIREAGVAKLVYEFDAADVGRSYIYPAMARSFREAGIQLATHFSYDPTFMAYANTEYNTHYMNLAYAPQKALSLMIASEVFHRLPLYGSFGSYPDNTTFGPFRVSYEESLAEMLSEKKFIYTCTTESTPPAPERLEQIAGFGHSPVVQYDGLGAYFLDKIEEGVWRLEVMPDAVWVGNPFGRNSLDKKVAVIKWKEWPITIELPGLGENFTIKGLNQGNSYIGRAEGQSFAISPGAYLLARKGMTAGVNGNSHWKNILLGEFSAPPENVRQPHVVHQPLQEAIAGRDLEVKATVVAPGAITSAELYVYTRGRMPDILKMECTGGYDYTASIPGDLTNKGFLRYYIVVKNENGFHSFPSGAKGRPTDWDFFQDTPYRIPLVENESPVYIFDAWKDSDKLVRKWLPGSHIAPAGFPNKAELLCNVEKLFSPDPENQNGEKHFDYSFRFFFGEKTRGRKESLSHKKAIVIRGRALNDKPCPLQLAIVLKDGSAFGGMLQIQPQKKDYALSLSDLKRVKLVTLPRPYPTFLPYYFDASPAEDFDINNAESIQFSIGPGIPENERNDAHGIAIESVRLE
ncbi:MAG: hypothetical protein H6560_14085 [Lewinellaceae bacterium]|nr:hypothetical protein [Lewinellaceae bacterium]